MSKNKTGFTLVELSIVLVIIGLLIGGVLVGQSLIESSRLNQVVSQINQVNIMARTYKDRFSAIPGDDPRAEDYWGSLSGSCETTIASGVETCSGDGDGRIDNNHFSGNLVHEGIRFWQHLQNAQILNAEYTGASGLTSNSGCAGGTPICYLPGVNGPVTPYGDDTVLAVLGQGVHTGGGSGFNGKNELRSIIALAAPERQGNSGDVGRYHSNFFTPSQMLSFDAKIDDGAPFTGIVTTVGHSRYGDCYIGSYPSAAASYNLDFDDFACPTYVDAEFDKF